ncbi:MAG TPA: hypothetical protein VNN76_00825 [Bacteroidota bacterium]|nr:hypothetical protein [Bacteroidota bacterium]
MISKLLIVSVLLLPLSSCMHLMMSHDSHESQRTAEEHLTVVGQYAIRVTVPELTTHRTSDCVVKVMRRETGGAVDAEIFFDKSSRQRPTAGSGEHQHERQHEISPAPEWAMLERRNGDYIAEIRPNSEGPYIVRLRITRIDSTPLDQEMILEFTRHVSAQRQSMGGQMLTYGIIGTAVMATMMVLVWVY